MTSSIMKALPCLLACVCLAGCGDWRSDAKPPGLDEFNEFMAKDTLPIPDMTREQALAEHRKCTRELHGPDEGTNPALRTMKKDPSRACDYWLKRARPEPRHARRRHPDSMYIEPAPLITPTMTREERDRRLLEGLESTDDPALTSRHPR